MSCLKEPRSLELATCHFPHILLNTQAPPPHSTERTTISTLPPPNTVGASPDQLHADPTQTAALQPRAGQATRRLPGNLTPVSLGQ